MGAFRVLDLRLLFPLPPLPPIKEKGRPGANSGLLYV